MRTLNSGGEHRTDSAPGFVIRCFIDSLYFGTRFLVIAGAAFVGILLSLLVVLRFVNPPISAVMLQHWLAGQPVQQSWVPLTRISGNLQRAVVASEDAKFCRHPGLDLGELAYVMRQAHRQGSLDVRGASTITMQVSRNLFLWQGKSLLRKALEIAIAPIMDFVWPKRRILEVYLNIAEWGPGRFGAETGALYHFNQSANRLNRSQATLMASALPNPRFRRPGTPSAALKRRARRLQARTKRLTPLMSCLNL